MQTGQDIATFLEKGDNEIDREQEICAKVWTGRTNDIIVL